MPDLFSPFTLKGVTLRNRIVMSPMTMYNSVDGKLDDYHVSYLGARAAGGFGLIFGEQMAITSDGRTTTSCAGIWDDAQIEGHARVCSIIERMGGVPAIQLGHTGRKGSELPPHKGVNEQGTWKQLPPDHADGWECVSPSAIPYGGGGHIYPVRELSVDDIKALHQSYADAARRALEAGYKWLEMHYAHGYLGASFFSPLANQRSDQYGGSVENRARFHLEALDAVRAVWPEEYPLTMRLGSDDLHPEGVQFDDAITAIRMMKDHGLDLADLSLGFNTDEMTEPPFGEVGFMLKRANRVREEVGIPVATSWNLGVPANADRAIRDGLIDLVFLGRPALANPHWPVWAARELAHNDPFHLVPNDWAWWLRNFRGHGPSIGLPPASASREGSEAA
ncbi:NADH:flavin oxidoreductase/NADH oxidase [Lichenihabitans sp. Uapishka_5]|uniref:NADH:flavin oxidoreductase/NADH oxidase n=1 Tax=Lichenihabitans sp. Uapishka_5 TaxID=3037302 RepID=UPI0029E7D034|nr:NADH:flavin oxidoreductase/NADH oxidase [Lichenihabitans sp. Uapishka_5]MDX7951872.1 NADH:flavin oxidoreductase/NADH oxidase [Lichenihabitans sp. Uapishka_5]